MPTEKCLFCDYDAEFKKGNTVQIECPNCGYYVTSRSFADRDTDIVKKYAPYKHLISGLIREKNDKGLTPELITNENFMHLLNDTTIPKTLIQKLDKILIHYYRITDLYGLQFNIVRRLHVYSDEIIPYAIGYATCSSEFNNMLDDLVETNYFKNTTDSDSDRQISISLTRSGIERAEQLISTNLDSDKVFVAMQFNQGIEEAHESAIYPACKECGYDSFLIKDVDHNNGITDEIIAQIKTSKFIIADFTHNNNGVYFEAGYAQGRGLEVIRTCQKEWFEQNGVHFDIKHYNLILWEDYEDLRKKLVNRIKATIWK